MNRNFKHLFTRNWGLKLTALLLSFILWMTLIPEEKINSDKTFVVALETRNRPADFEVVEKPQATVEVTLRANNRVLNQLSAANVHCILNLEKATVNQEDYPLNPDLIAAPGEAKVVRVMPNKVRLKIERGKEVSMEIAPEIIGKPKAGFKVVRTELIPSKAIVRGAESKIKPKDKIRTSPIDITGLAQTADFEADIILPKPELRLKTAQTKVRVRVVIAAE
jgi:YbbR domain-containing protein